MILGHRVDLEELKSILHSLPGVQEAAVLPRRNSGDADELLALVVPADSEVPADLIRLRLSNLVPALVLPKVLVLERLPLTPVERSTGRSFFNLRWEAVPFHPGPSPR